MAVAILVREHASQLKHQKQNQAALLSMMGSPADGVFSAFHSNAKYSEALLTRFAVEFPSCHLLSYHCTNPLQLISRFGPRLF